MSQPLSPMKIGPHRLAAPVLLAPMAGVSDWAMRTMAWRWGAGLATAEMVHSRPDLRDSMRSQVRLRAVDNHSAGTLHSVQIVGTEPALMAQAAVDHVQEGAQIIDINMGCPAKKVCRKAAGSALLRDEGLVREILCAVVERAAVPVTLKIRTGWSPEERNGVQIAELAQSCGIAALTVHGRTRACRFKPDTVEYETIAAIVAAVSIPVIANGDISSPEQALAVRKQTGAAGIMIGRAAQGQPWLLGQVADAMAGRSVQSPPRGEDWCAEVLTHLALLQECYGEQRAVRIARKHVQWYVEHFYQDRFLRSNRPCEAAGAGRHQHTLTESPKGYRPSNYRTEQMHKAQDSARRFCSVFNKLECPRAQQSMLVALVDDENKINKAAA